MSLRDGSKEKTPHDFTPKSIRGYGIQCPKEQQNCRNVLSNGYSQPKDG